jgi:DNA-directed RNA polymerase specialized sigma24 family protein
MPEVPADSTAATAASLARETGLIDAARGGDESAWTELVDRHLDTVWSAALALGLPEIEAEQVCGLVWLRLAQRLTTAPTPLRPWLLEAVELEASRRHMALAPRNSTLVMLDAARRHGEADGATQVQNAQG